MRTYNTLESGLQNKIDSVLDSMKAGDKGDYIKNKPYPSRYVKDGAKNLYRYPISDYRLVYTVVGTRDSKIYLVLDFLTHKEYDVLFGYHTS